MDEIEGNIRSMKIRTPTGGVRFVVCNLRTGLQQRCRTFETARRVSDQWWARE